MAAKRGNTQARRGSGGNSGMPGWAWMLIGVVVTLALVIGVPRLLKPEAEEGFFRPQPNPDARPAAATSEPEPDVSAPAPIPEPDTPPAETEYDFYTMLPEQEVPMSDAELAASARAEAERRQRAQAQQQARHPDAADLADDRSAPRPLPEPPAPATTQPTPPATQPATPRPATTSPAASTAATSSDTRYILQAGSFSASGDAEALKARIALLGLSARVESAQADGRTVYRVRMGPYATATELADAKQKLGNGGLPALAIKAQ